MTKPAKPTFHRSLISAMVFDRRRDVYFVDVLRVDGTLNWATRTGLGSTVFMTREQVAEAMKLHGAKSKSGLIGAPIQCRVSYDGGNVFGSSSFAGNTL